MLFLKGLSLGIYYRLRRINKALKNWRKFGIIIFGSIFVLVSIFAPLQAVGEVQAADSKLTYLYIDPSTASIEQGKTYQFKYRAEDQNHNAMAITPNWSVANSVAGNITSTGLFTASNTPGTYNNAIKLSSGALSTYARVIVTKSADDGNGGGTITPPPATTPKLTYLYIDPSTISLGKGKAYQMKYRAEDASHNPIAITPQWSMSKSLAGNISQTGLLTASQTPGTFVNAVKLSAGALSTYAKVIVTTSTTTIITPPVVPVTPPATSTLKLTYLYIDPSTASIEQGKTYQFKYRAEDQNHQAMAITPNWSVANSLSGNITSTGLFTASNTPGTYNNAIKLSSGALSTYARVIVTKSSIVVPPTPTSKLTYLYIDPSTASIEQGKTYQFKYRAEDQNHQAMAITPNWSVANSLSGNITSTGLFTASNTPGTYNNAIKLSSGALSTYARVIVYASSVIPTTNIASVNISPDSATIYVGGQKQYTATAYDQNGNVLNGASFQWSVISSASGSINQNGLFTAGNYPGIYGNNIKVLATYNSNTVADYASVTVLSNPVQSTLYSVVINPSAVQMQTGSNYQFTATAYDQNNQILNDVNYSWTVVNGGGWVDQSGRFTAGYEIGTFANTIHLLGTRNGVSKSAYATITVYNVITQSILDRVEITPSSTSLGINNQFDFNAQAYDNNNNALFNDVSYNWSVISGGGSINQSGLYSAPNYTGMVTVQVQASQGGITRYALATVTVTDNYQPSGDISTVRITPSVAYLSVGSSVDFNAQAYNAYGSPVSADYSWSLMSNIGSIDQNGYFVAGGTIGTYHDVVRVRAYRNGVERVDYADVVISGGGGQNNYGLTSTLTATDENGGNTEEGDMITYTLQVTNQNNSALTNVHASFEVPQYTSFVSVSSHDGTPTITGRTINWDAGTLYANYNYTKTLTIRVRVNSDVPANAVVKGKAYVWASEINSFWVYANDLFVAGTGQIDYGNDIPLADTGAIDWIIAGLTALVGTLLSKKFLIKAALR